MSTLWQSQLSPRPKTTNICLYEIQCKDKLESNIFICSTVDV